MSASYFILATEAIGERQWFAGTMPSPSGLGFLTTLCDVIIDAYDFETREAAETCVEELNLKGFEIVSCETQVSPALARDMKRKGRRS